MSKFSVLRSASLACQMLGIIFVVLSWASVASATTSGTTCSECGCSGSVCDKTRCQTAGCICFDSQCEAK